MMETVICWKKHGDRDSGVGTERIWTWRGFGEGIVCPQVQDDLPIFIGEQALMMIKDMALQRQQTWAGGNECRNSKIGGLRMAVR